MDKLHPPDWFLQTTGAQVKATGTLAVGVYYARIDLQGSCSFGGTFITDGVIVGTITVDGNDAPSGVAAATDYAAVGTGGWTDESEITDVTISAASTSFALGHVVDFERSRARVRFNVTTGGVCTFYPTIKGR